MDMKSFQIALLPFGLLYVENFLTITIRNGHAYPVYMKTCNVLFVFENICDYYYMIGFISEESLNFGLLTFLNLL